MATGRYTHYKFSSAAEKCIHAKSPKQFSSALVTALDYSTVFCISRVRVKNAVHAAEIPRRSTTRDDFFARVIQSREFEQNRNDTAIL